MTGGRDHETGADRPRVNVIQREAAEAFVTVRRNRRSGRCEFMSTGGDTMDTPKVFESEYRFCLILWKHEPINSTKLAGICKEELGWSRTTTFTVIRRLSDRGVVKNENATVTSLISKEDVQVAQMDEMMEKVFEGSLPAFVAAFARRQELSEEEVKEILRIIEK